MRIISRAGHDIRHACRSIAGMPALAGVIVVSLGAGIGINTVVFSWIQARLMYPLPGVSGGLTYQVVEPRNEAGMYPGTSWSEYRDLRERLQAFRTMLAFRMVPLYVGEPGRVERAYGQLVSDNYFSGLGLDATLGRLLRAEDFWATHRASGADDEGAGPNRSGGVNEPVAVISYGFWQTRFSGSPRVVGERIRINGNHFTVVGVAPKAFQGTSFGLNFDIWVPATQAPLVVRGTRELDERSVRGYSVLAQLRDSTSRGQAQAELDVAMGDLARAYPESNGTVTGEVRPIWQSPRGPQRMLTAALTVLQAVMLLLLLAVCGNTANLVLARTSARRKEVGIRLALGASHRQVAMLLLVENLVLALLGAALGAVVAVWGTQSLRILPLTGLPIRFQTGVDAWGLFFAVALGLAAGLLVGAPAAVQLARVDPQQALRSGQRSAARSQLRNALMGIQVALAIAVLTVAGLFLQSFMDARRSDPGFVREGVLLAAYDLSGRNAGPAGSRDLASRLLERLRALPSVEAAAIATSVPLDIHGLPIRVFTLDGRARADGRFDQALANTVTPGYFDVMGIAFRAGADFADLRDTTTASQVIVNEAFVHRYLDDEAVRATIGRVVQARGRRYLIAGVVRNSLYNAFGEPPTPIIYFSYRDSSPPLGEIHVRSRAGAEISLAPEIRRIVRELDAELPVFNVRTLTEHVDTNLIFRRVPARMFAFLGPLLLVLAGIGIYAVVSYTVSLRTVEIGVRAALGATRSRIVLELLRESGLAIGLGAVFGWLVALIITLDVVSGSPNPGVFLGVPAALLGVALLACWVPARRALALDPMVALRTD